MTTPSRCEKAMEELSGNPYFEKYAQKIASLQKTSPEEFLSRVEDHKTRKEFKPEPVKERQFTSLLEPKKAVDLKDGAQEESLDKIMKLDLIKDKDVDEIKEIWLKYHVQKETIAAVITSSDYDKILEQALKTPLFLFPLPRSQGYEFIMCQFQNNSIHFTPLICYQVHKENAPECLTIKNYTEFKDSKGIVLMRGEYDKNTIDAKEAQCLANQVQLYYNQNDEAKVKLMELFNNKPDEFKHMDLIKQIESLSL